MSHFSCQTEVSHHIKSMFARLRSSRNFAYTLKPNLWLGRGRVLGWALGISTFIFECTRNDTCLNGSCNRMYVQTSCYMILVLLLPTATAALQQQQHQQWVSLKGSSKWKWILHLSPHCLKSRKFANLCLLLTAAAAAANKPSSYSPA